MVLHTGKSATHCVILTSGVFPIIGFSYAEAPFDLGVVSPNSPTMIRDIHRASSPEIFGPSSATFTNSFGKSRSTRYWRLPILLLTQIFYSSGFGAPRRRHPPQCLPSRNPAILFWVRSLPAAVTPLTRRRLQA